MAKKKEIPASEYPKGLKEALAELPHVETAYVKGDQWHFVKREGFTAVDREDILESDSKVSKEPSEDPTE